MANPRTTANFAELRVDEYAGEDTAKVEEMYRRIGCREGRIKRHRKAAAVC